MLQGGEIIIILFLALIVLGPKRLPEVAQKLGKWTAELRAAARDIRLGLENEVADLKDVTEDLKKVGEDLKRPLDELKQPIDEIKRDVSDAATGPVEWTGPKPVSGPTPEDAMADFEEMNKAAEDEGGM
ncbi:MAG TPA: twin-arginine translocase TatA/TatE family subunit [Acidimicrobiia bacterium]|nr:twin-arginine translocase TatA/TatE family subunit [Acidimicrobiia bacterium]